MTSNASSSNHEGIHYLSNDEVMMRFDIFFQKWTFENHTHLHETLQRKFDIVGITNMEYIQNKMKTELSNILDLGFDLKRRKLLQNEVLENYQILFKKAQSGKAYIEQHHIFCGGLSKNNVSDIFIKIPSTFEFENLSSFQKLIFHAIDTVQKYKYKRYENDIYEEIKNPHPTRAWQRRCSIIEFINNEFSMINNYTIWLLLTSSKDMDRRVSEYIAKTFDERFPELKKNRNIFSFKNGVYISHVYDSENKPTYIDKFVQYTSPEFQDLQVTSCKYFDLDMDIENHETPVLDSIFQYQDISNLNISIIKMFIGRMLYNVGLLDDWQVIMMFIGSGGTGKSTITNIIKKFYENDDVGVISNNFQTIFGLGDIYNKYIYIAPEIKRDWKIDQAEFQEMISGGKMNINKKHQSSVMVDWTVPGILAGNENPGFTDNALSIQRRIVVSRFDTKVENADGNLSKKLYNEISSIIRSCNLQYLKYARLHGDKDLWSWIPPYFKETQKLMTTSTNTLNAFLDSDNIRFGTDLFIPKDVFFKEYNIFCNNNNMTKNKITIDFYKSPFQKYKITINKCVQKTYRNRDYSNYTFLYGVDISF